MNKTFLLDLGERAVKTFLQAALAVVAVQWVSSGLGSNIFDGSAWQKIGTAAVAAGLAAVVSLVTSLVSAAKTGTASASVEVATTGVVKGDDSGHVAEHSADTGVTAVD